ncbi:MAG: hypothetical protein ABW208_21515 [Pyrinomonadaceae bacterium]
MVKDAVEKFFDEFKERFRQLVRETVAEELEPLRDVLLRPAGDDSPPPVSELVDVTEVARLLGEDVSTERARRRAAQKVYDLARRKLIPSVRVSPRRVRFDLAAVKRSLSESPAAPENACHTSPRPLRSAAIAPPITRKGENTIGKHQEPR